MSDYAQGLQSTCRNPALPASAATAEIFFNGFRRLKTYLRSLCGQLRLNNYLATCHVHKEIRDAIDISSLMNEFVLANYKRAAVFGHCYCMVDRFQVKLIT